MRLSGAASVSPDIGAFVRMQLRSEAVATCLLDGEPASLPELLALEAGQAASQHSSAGQATTRCLGALEASLRLVPGDSVSSESAAAVVAILQGTNGSNARARAFLREILDRDSDRAGLPAVVRAGLAQGRTELAGPFGPDRGRAGRLLGSSLLNQGGGNAVPLSSFLLGRAGEYRDQLHSVVQSGSWSDWIGFFLVAVAESADTCVDEIARAAALLDEHRKTMGAHLGYAVSKGLLVLDRMARLPLASVADVREITNTSYVAANTLVSRLADLAILEEATGHRRNRAFLYGSYVGVFQSARREDRPLAAPAAQARAPRPPRRRAGRRALPAATGRATLDRPRRDRAAATASRKGGGTISDHLL